MNEEECKAYEVTWSTYIEAASPIAAAEIAYDELQKNSGSVQTIFVVYCQGTKTVVDVYDGSVVEERHV